MKKIISLIFVVLLISGCSKKTDNEYLSLAKESWKQNNIPAAIKAYQSIVDEYPGSKLAPKALMELGKLYQYKVDKTLNNQEASEKAIDCFKAIGQKYPKSEEAPVALFMTAFIQANELKEYDEATKNYKLFLDKYPNHPMSQNAKDEIKNMGLSPAEILDSKLSDEN